MRAFCPGSFSGHTVRRAELPPPGIELVSPEVEARSLNHWTAQAEDTGKDSLGGGNSLRSPEL